MTASAWELLAGAGLDLVIGDPRWLPHPVRGFGWLATRLERWLWAPKRWRGVLFWAFAVGSAALVVAASVRWIPYVSVYWIWALLAIRDLDVEAMVVVRQLDRGDIEEARRKLSWIVGRDTAELDAPEILRAAVETVAENLSDAVVAPLFWLAVAGPIGMGAYKAVNTLDSMVGYRNERYREFGWCAARMDDAANFVPARLTALLVWIAAAVLGYDARRSVRVTLRDAARQPSPNSGYPEAAMAGALGVRLGGLNYYGGVAHAKEYLGDAVRPLDRGVFTGVRMLLYSTAVLMIGALAAVLR